MPASGDRRPHRPRRRGLNSPLVPRGRVTREATRTASLQVTAEMMRLLRGEMPDVLVNPEVKDRLGLK